MNSLYIYRDAPRTPHDMTEASKQKTVVVGAGPVGALAALYAAQRGHDVEVYELRNGTCGFMIPVVLYDEVLSPRFSSWRAHSISRFPTEALTSCGQTQTPESMTRQNFYSK